MPNRGKRDGQGQDRPRENNDGELDPKNPYVAASLKTGDWVVYKRNESDLGTLVQIEIAGPTTERLNGGAWLLDGNGQRITTSPSESPEKTQIYKYASPERALAEYQRVLPLVDTKQKLFSLFFALERSGVLPGNPLINIRTDKWTKVVDTFNMAQLRYRAGNPEDIKNFTNTNGLRDAIARVLENESKIPAELVRSIKNMAVGQKIIVSSITYIKFSPEYFSVDTPSSKLTVAVRNVENLTEAALMKIIQRVGKEFVQIMPMESGRPEQNWKEKYPASENFKRLLPELYATRVGLSYKMADFLAKMVGKDRPATYEEVLQYLPQSEIKQGNIGDCYLLAGINSLKKTRPDLYLHMLSQTLRKNPTTNNWEVKFLGMELEEMRAYLGNNFNGWIPVSEEDLNSWAMRGVSADLPDLILERAYASYISRIEEKQVGKTLIRVKDNEFNWMAPFGSLPIEGGFAHRALYDLLGPEIATKKIISDYDTKTLEEKNEVGTTKNFLQRTAPAQPGRFIITANTPYKRLKILQLSGGHIYFNLHAYSIFLTQGNTIRIENPHNTARSSFLNFDQFVKTFSQISFVELK